VTVVPSGSEWGTMVADAAVEIWEAAGPGGMSWRRAHDAAEKGLLAALRAVTTEPCEVCWGRGNDVTPAARCKAGCDSGEVRSFAVPRVLVDLEVLEAAGAIQRHYDGKAGRFVEPRPMFAACPVEAE